MSSPTNMRLRALAIELMHKGMSCNATARKLNLNNSTVWRWSIEANIKLGPACRPSSTPKTPKSVTRAALLYRLGYTLEEIAQFYDVVPGTVINWLEGAGVERRAPGYRRSKALPVLRQRAGASG